MRNPWLYNLVSSSDKVARGRILSLMRISSAAIAPPAPLVATAAPVAAMAEDIFPDHNRSRPEIRPKLKRPQSRSQTKQFRQIICPIVSPIGGGKCDFEIVEYAAISLSPVTDANKNAADSSCVGASFFACIV